MKRVNLILFGALSIFSISAFAHEDIFKITVSNKYNTSANLTQLVSANDPPSFTYTDGPNTPLSAGGSTSYTYTVQSSPTARAPLAHSSTSDWDGYFLTYSLSNDYYGRSCEFDYAIKNGSCKVSSYATAGPGSVIYCNICAVSYDAASNTCTASFTIDNKVTSGCTLPSS